MFTKGLDNCINLPRKKKYSIRLLKGYINKYKYIINSNIFLCM